MPKETPKILCPNCRQNIHDNKCVKKPESPPYYSTYLFYLIEDYYSIRENLLMEIVDRDKEGLLIHNVFPYHLRECPWCNEKFDTLELPNIFLKEIIQSKIAPFMEENRQLQTENEQLKEENETIKKIHNEIGELLKVDMSKIDPKTGDT